MPISKTFDQKQAIGFKANLSNCWLAQATVLSTINALKSFLGWLAMQAGYKTRIRLDDIEYLNLSDKFTRAAAAPKERPFPELAMIERVIATMPDQTPLQKRNRALIAFTAITGIRDGAVYLPKAQAFRSRPMPSAAGSARGRNQVQQTYRYLPVSTQRQL